MLEPGRRYVYEDRGLSEELVREVEIGGCVSGWFSGRVIIPVLSPEGEWIWYIGRDRTGEAEKKYVYPRGGRGGALYNHAALLEDLPDDPVLIVEGAFDALAVWPDGVGVLGKPNASQFDALASTRRPVAIVLDGDAYDEAYTLAMRLRLEGQRAGAVKLPAKVDPDEVDLDQLMACARRAIVEGEAVF